MLVGASYTNILDPSQVETAQSEAAKLDIFPAKPDLEYVALMAEFARFVCENKNVKATSSMMFEVPIKGEEKKQQQICNCVLYPVLVHGLSFVEWQVDQSLREMIKLDLVPPSGTDAWKHTRIDTQDAIGVCRHLREFAVEPWMRSPEQTSELMVFLFDARKRINEANSMLRWMALYAHAQWMGFPTPDPRETTRASKRLGIGYLPKYLCSMVECKRNLSPENTKRVAACLPPHYAEPEWGCLLHYAYENAGPTTKEYGKAIAAGQLYETLSKKRLPHLAEWINYNKVHMLAIPKFPDKEFNWEFFAKETPPLHILVHGKELPRYAHVWKLKGA